MVSDINWDEIITKFRPLLLLKPDSVWFYPSMGSTSEEKQRLEDPKTFFVNAVAHELFTPITAMLGLIQIAKDGENIHENLLKIERHLLRMQRIVEQLLLLSRFEREDYQPKLVKIDLNNLLMPLLNEFEQKSKEKNLHFHIELSKTVTTDTEFFRMALRNLLSNSIKYSHPFGKIVICSQNDFLTIKDEGVGIPENDLRYITARFYRATNARSYTGSGLGLAIVKHIFRKLGVSWAVHSKLNFGTVVFVELKSD